MQKLFKWMLLSSLMCLTAPLWADGKFFAEKVPPGIPYQRAILFFDGNQETLLLQSKYSISDSNSDSFLGWVVPVPNVPDFASIPAGEVRYLFFMLSLAARPIPISISSRILLIIFLMVKNKFSHPTINIF